MEHSLSVKTDTDEYTLQGRPCELSAFSFVPTSRNDPGERTYYNSKHKKNRQTSKGQEKEKDVPTLSSSEYGHHLHMFADPSDRKHVRIAHVKKDFYRNNGIYTHS
ncbi:hypothetical protein KUTeg_019474 [Tegillarca granosa]|uniref:Uncharacterized protein n=1 Tax=Tegillarca granosa TaxID=220873 RepID=A0ABQ9ECM2_TEGGR|nr:hypothetical protein KUTeg_019474 [Tegillarca granosa]